ncbi:MAG: hypothetical protein EZS28_036337 [Streblomastix strix]|uniref:Uncharacterized protein n=1 Tax=Streblomastix strix TaxID=222440 RepID=A0A5J4UBD8_9EUKA|nr:MAG: hypothetical protein EZS28_036337 [Streblomastix strix]
MAFAHILADFFVVFDVIFLLSLLGQLIPRFIIRILKPLDLKKRYGGGFAFITGGNSGIGEQFAKKAICRGGVLFTASLDVFIYPPGSHVYGATKEYLGHQGQCLASEEESTDKWHRILPDSELPQPRSGHTSAINGSEMLIFFVEKMAQER